MIYDTFACPDDQTTQRMANRDHARSIMLEVCAMLRDRTAATGDVWHSLHPIAEHLGIPLNKLTLRLGYFPRTIEIHRNHARLLAA